MQKRIDELKIGDLVDLANDPFADPGGDNPDRRVLDFEYARVVEIARETAECIVVEFDSVTCGFPPGHLVTVEE